MRSFLQHLKFIVSFLRGQLTNHDMQRTLLKSGRIQIAPFCVFVDRLEWFSGLPHPQVSRLERLCY